MNQKKQTLQHLNRNVKCFKKQPENAWNSTMERKHSYVKKTQQIRTITIKEI